MVKPCALEEVNKVSGLPVYIEEQSEVHAGTIHQPLFNRSRRYHGGGASGPLSYWDPFEAKRLIRYYITENYQSYFVKKIKKIYIFLPFPFLDYSISKKVINNYRSTNQ